MKKLAALLLTACLLLSACGAQEPEPTTTAVPTTTEETTAASTEDPTKNVGIALAGSEEGHWAAEGAALQKKLEAMGYRVTLVYAGNDAQHQADQIDKMITAESDCLVVAGVDSLALTQPLSRAKTQQIPVIAYDRMLTYTDAVRYCVAPDAYGAGKAMAEHTVAKLELATAQEKKRTYRTELFMGSPEDPNSLRIYQGMMEVLQPYFDSGVLKSLSGRTAFEDCCTPDWSGDTARDDCADYLAGFYKKEKPDVLFAASDALAAGVCAALEEAGFVGKKAPLVTGCGADADAVTRLTAGSQGMTLYMDRQLLVEECALAVEALLHTGQAPATETQAYYNGSTEVLSRLLPMTVVTAENHTEVLPKPPEETVPETTAPAETVPATAASTKPTK